MKSKALVLVTCLFLMSFGSLAHAQATRTWVSGVGDDANPCSRTAPCKTFAGAISKTAVGGEINALDPAGYGAVTITKPLTIDGGGVLASILHTGAPGININTAGPTDTVILRNLEINGIGSGTRGVNILNAKNVVLQNVNIYNETGGSPSGTGVYIGTPAVNVNVTLRNVAITNNAAQGINCNPTGGSVNLTIENSRIEQNATDGVNLVANCKAAIDNTVISQNGGAAVKANAGTTDANVSNSLVTFNYYGMYSSGSTIWLYATRMSHNTYPIFTLAGGNVRTHGNTAVVNNVDPTLPSPNVGQQ
jgi:hypothetical protein